MSHLAEEWHFVRRPVFHALVARPADRDQIVRTVGRSGRREQPDRYLVMDVKLPSQRLLRNATVPASEAVPFSRQRGLHLPVPAPELRSARQDQTFLDARKYGCPRLEAGLAAKVQPHFLWRRPLRDAKQATALFASRLDLPFPGPRSTIREMQLQLVQTCRNIASHAYRPGHNASVSGAHSANHIGIQ